MDQYQQNYQPGPTQQFQPAPPPFPSGPPAQQPGPPQQLGAPLITPGVPKAERVTALIAAVVIIVGVFIMGIMSFDLDKDVEAGTAIASMTGGTLLILAHTVSVSAIAYAVILLLRLTGKSPGKQSL